MNHELLTDGTWTGLFWGILPGLKLAFLFTLETYVYDLYRKGDKSWMFFGQVSIWCAVIMLAVR